MGPLPTLGRTEGSMAWAPAMGVITKVSHTLLIVKICSYLFSQRPVMIHGNLAKLLEEPVSMLRCLGTQNVGSVVHVHAVGHEFLAWPF